MSQEDQDAAIVKLVKRRTEVKRIMGMLEMDFLSCGTSLQAFGEDMKKHFPQTRGPQSDWLERSLALLSPKVQDQVREYLAARAELEELKESAAKIGID